MEPAVPRFFSAVPKWDLELVQVVAKGRHLHLEVLALADLQNQLLHLAALVQRISWQVLPVIEDALREGLSTGGLSQGRHEAEGLGHGEVGLHLHQGRSLALVLLEDAAAAQVHAVVHAAHGLLGTGDLHQEDGLLQGWLGGQLRGEAASAGWRHDLSSTTVDGIGVQRHIHQVELDASHVLLAQRSFLGGPLEGAVHVLLDLNEVLHTHRGIHHQVGAIGLRAIAPDLGLRHLLVPAELVAQNLGALLGIGLGSNDAILDGLAELLIHGLSLQVDAVVLVG
eukprot:Skav232648  [mRNA]  locus=scaffold2334:107781:121188:+ [translate_table: standard]